MSVKICETGTVKELEIKLGAPARLTRELGRIEKAEA